MTFSDEENGILQKPEFKKRRFSDEKVTFTEKICVFIESLSRLTNRQRIFEDESFVMRAFAGEVAADSYESVFLAYKTHR